MADRTKPLAPGGVLAPEDDINFRLNPKFEHVPAPYHAAAPGPPETPEPPHHVPSGGPPASANPPDYDPPDGPGSTPNPSGHVPATGPDGSPNPPGHIPDDGPDSTANPPGYQPPADPDESPNPPGHVPVDGPASTPGPGPYQPPPDPDDTPNPPAHVPDDGPPSSANPPGHVPDFGAKSPPVSPPLAPNGRLDPRRDVQFIAHHLDPALRELVDGIDVPGILGIGPGTRHSITGGGAQGSKALDPLLYTKWLINVGNSLGKEGLALFALEQSALFALNGIEKRQFWNPLYFLNRAPILNNFIPVQTLGDLNPFPIVGERPGPHEKVVAEKELARTALAGLFGEGPDLEGNIYTPDVPMSVSPTPGADEVTDNILDGKFARYLESQTVQAASPGPISTNQGAVKRELFRPLDVLFTKTQNRLGTVPTRANSPDLRPNKDLRASSLGRSAFANGIIPMDFPKEDATNAVLTKPGQRPQDVIPDDEAYVPLSFTDLRPLPGSKALRTVYFRPIIRSLSENLSPEWNKDSLFGRVDPVALYGGTARTFQIGFELHAFAPEDLDVIYRKLNWLASMVYPEYDKELIMKSGPVCRMRVGDVIKSGQLGVPGIIDSLDFDYTDAIWELKKEKKVPRSVSVTVSFTALHDTPIGRGPSGLFGGIGVVSPDGRYLSSDESSRSIPSVTSQGSSLASDGGSPDDFDVRSPGAFRGFGILNKE
jgi:hypothetical protein